MNDLFLSVIAVSVGASAAGLVWALVQKRLEKRVCARWRCRVWTLLLTALLVLPLAGLLPESKAVANRPAFVLEVPEAAARPMGSGERTQEQAGPQTLPSGGTFVPAGEEPTQPGRTLPSPLTVAAAVWLLGAAGMLAVQMASYLRWRHGVRRWEQPAPDWVEPVVRAAAVEAGLSSLPRVRQSPLGASPMMAGLASPTLLLPVKLPPKEELALILAHEMAHCRRRDIQRKLLILLARAVHWFNPLLHWMAGQAQREIELACDETVAASRPPQWRQAYCQALLHAIDAAGQPAPVLSTRFALEKQEIMRRFARVMRPVKGKKGAAVFGLMALLALLCCCGLRVQLPSGESTSEPASAAVSGTASESGTSAPAEENNEPPETKESTAARIAETDPLTAQGYLNAFALVDALKHGDQQAVNRCFALSGEPVYDAGFYALSDISGLELNSGAVGLTEQDGIYRVFVDLDVEKRGNTPLLEGQHTYWLTFHDGSDSFYDEGCIWKMQPESDLDRHGVPGPDAAQLEELQDEVKLVRNWLSREGFSDVEDISPYQQLAYLFVRMRQKGELAEDQPATLEQLADAAKHYLGISDYQPAPEVLREMCDEEQGGWQLKAMGGLLEGPEPASRFTQVYRQGRDYVVVLWESSDAQGLVPEYGYFYRMNNTENEDGSWRVVSCDVMVI
ncbi:MAG: M56 family metallopeptidase [Fournierella sp.]|uniref:M56 family metallopeptidase n=1 Tax=Allofournierella sp. TaxID=1940256 RepID=UPI002A7FBBD9|nr:M56 family metallopeptidase [Fournierella sp.]MDY4168076.1 M56 family metallopeptidase [Fournierella sp.]